MFPIVARQCYATIRDGKQRIIQNSELSLGNHKSWRCHPCLEASRQQDNSPVFCIGKTIPKIANNRQWIDKLITQNLIYNSQLPFRSKYLAVLFNCFVFINYVIKKWLASWIFSKRKAVQKSQIIDFKLTRLFFGSTMARNWSLLFGSKYLAILFNRFPFAKYVLRGRLVVCVLSASAKWCKSCK